MFTLLYHTVVSWWKSVSPYYSEFDKSSTTWLCLYPRRLHSFPAKERNRKEFKFHKPKRQLAKHRKSHENPRANKEQENLRGRKNWPLTAPRINKAIKKGKKRRKLQIFDQNPPIGSIPATPSSGGPRPRKAKKRQLFSSTTVRPSALGSNDRRSQPWIPGGAPVTSSGSPLTASQSQSPTQGAKRIAR